MNLPPGASFSFPLLSGLIFAPLGAAAVALALRRDAAVRWWTLVSTLAVAGLSLPLLTHYQPDGPAFQFVERVRWIPPLRIEYAVGVDGLSLVMIVLTVALLPLCVLASWRAITTRVREFMIGLLLLESAMVGLFCALDFVLFFIFWEAMLIPMALLIGVWGGPRRVYAAVKFFIYTMAGSVFLLAAIVALFWETGTFHLPDLMGRPYSTVFQGWVFAAFFISFAIKVPMVPFHTWLPAAHVEAPTAGSVILASVLLKMGTYGFLRLSLPITPEAARLFGPSLAWLSVAAILYGGLAALAQSDLKKLVAYSSVGHMGFATLGIFSLNRAGLEGAILQMINHGITTGALFLMVGIIYERLHTRELAAAAGLGRRLPVLAALLGVFALSSMAFPGTNSFVGEFLALAGAFARAWPVALAAVPGVVLAAAYLLRLLQKVAYGGPHNPDHAGVTDLNPRELLALSPLAIGVFWIGLNPGPLVRLIEPSVLRLLDGVHPAAAAALSLAP